MEPKNYNNFIFDIQVYKKIFKPLEKINKSNYDFIIEIITKGANIKRKEQPPPNHSKNYKCDNIDLIRKVTKKFIKHIELGQMWGPHKLHKLPKLNYKIHLSPIACKLKSSGKAMMLIDESSPKDHSVNSEIEKLAKYVRYISFEDLCLLLERIGIRGWFWVIDAVDAYYRIPIQDRFYHLFGVEWLNRIIIYKCLSFGLSTAPSIYNRFADIILWACTYHKYKLFKTKSKNVFNILHYLDDFFGGHPNKKICKNQMKYVIWLFKTLNIPTNPSKVVGPTQAADILGWACRTKPKVQIGLAESKRIKYIEYIQYLLNQNAMSFKQSEKVIGYIRHTCKIFLTGNKFVRGIERQKFALDFARIHKKITKFTKQPLSPETKFDLTIWLQFLKDIKHRYLDIKYITKPLSLPKVTVWTDASTSYGAGGCSSLNNVYHLPWSTLKLQVNNLFSKNYKNDWKDHIRIISCSYTSIFIWKKLVK